MTKKEQIIDAAIELFNQHGLSNVTMRMVAEAAGLSIGNLHYHFQNKSEIVAEACEKARRAFEEIPLLDEIIFVGGMGLDHAQKGAAFARTYPFIFVNADDLKRYGQGALDTVQVIAHRAISIIQTSIYIGIGKGLMQAPPFEGYYDAMARTIFSEIFLRAPRQELMDAPEATERDIAFSVGILLYRNYTDKGREMFNARLEQGKEQAPNRD